MDIASRGPVAIDSRSSSFAAPNSSLPSTSINAAYRRVAIAMLGLDVPTLAEQLRSTRVAQQTTFSKAA
ncbi:MAG: hypothetical protein NVSMB2_05860 [Chloroflexota bacterium]